MKLLVADDSSLYRMLLKRLLEVGATRSCLPPMAMKHKHPRKRQRTPVGDSGLLDARTGRTELCELIRERKQGYVYTILLCAPCPSWNSQAQSDLLKGFELGADDYLSKPFKELELRARIKVGERIIRSHEELVEAREALKFEASHDPLLRIWNRRAILDLLTTELSRSKRLQTSLSVFFADLDCFKRVNDSYGHLVGDEVLRSAAEEMSGAVREYDHVGRYGGEEFLVVLPDCTIDEAREVAERVRQHIGEQACCEFPHAGESYGQYWRVPMATRPGDPRPPPPGGYCDVSS